MKIDKAVPVPEINKKQFVFPFLEMESGDSFYVDKSQYYAAVQSAYRYARENNKKAVSRKEGNGGRVWIFDKE